MSELTNDLGFATSAYVDEAIANAAPPEVYVPSALSDLENDIELIPSSIIEEMISSQVDAVEIPSKVSDLENDAEYVPRSVINDLSIQFSNRLLAIEASIPSTTTTLGSRSEGERDMMQNVQLVDRMDETEVIDYGDRA